MWGRGIATSKRHVLRSHQKRLRKRARRHHQNVYCRKASVMARVCQSSAYSSLLYRTPDTPHPLPRREPARAASCGRYCITVIQSSHLLPAMFPLWRLKSGFILITRSKKYVAETLICQTGARWTGKRAGGGGGLDRRRTRGTAEVALTFFCLRRQAPSSLEELYTCTIS